MVTESSTENSTEPVIHEEEVRHFACEVRAAKGPYGSKGRPATYLTAWGRSVATGMWEMFKDIGSFSTRYSRTEHMVNGELLPVVYTQGH